MEQETVAVYHTIEIRQKNKVMNKLIFVHNTTLLHLTQLPIMKVQSQSNLNISTYFESIPTASANYLTIFTCVILLIHDHQLLSIAQRHAPNFSSIAVHCTKRVVPNGTILYYNSGLHMNVMNRQTEQR